MVKGTPLSELKPNPENPRKITDLAIHTAAKSIFQLPQMLVLRPVVYKPESGFVLGGNVRLQGLKKLSRILTPIKFPNKLDGKEAVAFLSETWERIFPGDLPFSIAEPQTEAEAEALLFGINILKGIKEGVLPEGCAVPADHLTEEQEGEFVVKDNIPLGSWDWNALEEKWSAEQLGDWGLDVPEKKEPGEEGEITFSVELDQASNYIVLKFTKDIDWIQAQELFGLKPTYSKRQNGKPWSKGIGRVVDGVDAILAIKERGNEG